MQSVKEETRLLSRMQGYGVMTGQWERLARKKQEKK